MNMQLQRQTPINQNSFQVEREKIYQWILELATVETKENALLELRFELCFDHATL